MDDTRELTRRLELVERRCRRLQLLVLLVVIGASALMLMGQAPAQTRAAKPPQEQEVRAEAFTLVDDKGAERAQLVADGAGSVFLIMFDQNGRTRADLQVNNYGPSLNFYDPNGKTRVAVGSTTLVASHVNTDGMIERNTPSSIVMFDAGGKLLWRTP